MAGSTLDREQYKVAIPQLSAKLNELLDKNVIINRTVINLSDGKVSDLNSYLGYFQNLATGYFEAIAGDVQYLTSREAYINHLKADIAGFGYLTADSAVIENLQVGNLTIGGQTVNVWDKAVSAESTATAAQTSAIAAQNAATAAQADATAARTAAASAQTDATTAKYAADQAAADAERAYQLAEDVEGLAQQASEDAEDAKESAEQAQSAADNAMKGLGQVEDVVGTLNWITAHSKVTTDTTPTAGKSYYIKNQDGTFTLVTDVEGKNPAQEGWYELTEAVQNYILSHLVLMNDGLYVMADDSHWKVRIADDGVYIIDDTNGQNKVVAKYKDAITLGNDNGTESYQRLDYHSLKLIDKEGNTYFHVSDLRDASGKAEIVETTRGDGVTVRFGLSFPATGTDYSVTVNGVTATNVRKETTYVTFTTAPSSDDVIAFTYDTSSNMVKAFTFGGRRSGVIGALSTACGQSVLASGYTSHAEGDQTTASSYTSHAEGFGSIASGSHSHAEGYESTASGYASHAEGFESIASGLYSHAEGSDTIASNLFSHAEGFESIASGRRSHAQNRGTVAGYNDQTAIGKYNDNQSNNALEIGNGTSNNRSNAFEVDWNGNTTAAGDIEDGSGNVLADKLDSSGIFDLIYPVGSYYWTSNGSFSPANTFGGTWEKIDPGVTLVSAGTGYTVQSGTAKDGGNDEITLTDKQMAHGHTYTRPTVVSGEGGHTHTVNMKYTSNATPTGTGQSQPRANGTSTSSGFASIPANSGTHSHTLTGGDVADLAGASSTREAFDNMPPYKAAYCWHRTA